MMSLLLGCEEKNLERVLPPTKLFSNKAYLNILVKTLCYHISSIRNGDAAYAAVHTLILNSNIYNVRIPQHSGDLLAAALHTMTDTYVCNIYI